MKKYLALLLVVLMTVPFLASCADKPADPTSAAETTFETPTETPVPTDDTNVSSASEESTATTPGEYVDHYVDDDDRSDIPEVVEHQMVDYIPTRYSLVGTKHLPPIDNQGGIGSCASEGITYMQFTNAVSRYIESKGIDPSWNPASGNEGYIFAPKFTYNFAGSGTAWVYDVLRDHGSLLLKDWHFMANGEYKFGTTKSDRHPNSLNWPVMDGQLEDALNYRITDYEQIWTNSFDNKLTTSEEGQAMMLKIKDAVVQGNVVVTGGFSSNWKYAPVTAADAEAGTGEVGEMACVWCNGKGGGHQVAIVGFDDDFVCSLDGVQLKGAFQVANSWGTSWMNDGFFWVMYDSINAVSEHPELNDKEKYEGRVNSMDQFCFIYWDKDISLGLPEAYVTVEMTITDREGFYVEMTKTDQTDVSTTFLPAIFKYGMNFENVRGSRDTLEDSDKYVNFSGKIDKPAEKGVLTFGYQNLLSDTESFDDYLWGLNFYSKTAGFKIHKITLHDRTGKVRAEIVPPEGADELEKGASRSFVFDLGRRPKANHDIGSYHLKSVNDGRYIGVKVLLLIPTDKIDDAVRCDVTFDFFERYHLVKKEDYVLDIRGNLVEDGKPIQFNAASKKRNTQSWKVVRLEDGTYNIRLAANTDYAVGMKDGEIVLVSGKDIWDYGRWYFENALNESMSLTARADEGEVRVAGKLPASVKTDTVKVSVYGTDGTFIKTVDAPVNDGVVDMKIDGISSGNYVFTFQKGNGAYISACYYSALTL